ncbi:MAG: hypothetical protein V4667_03150 [Bacteroidota bacterium]
MSQTEPTITQTEKTIACSSCGGDLSYKPGTKSLKCKYCNSEQEIADVPAVAVTESDYHSVLQNSANLGDKQELHTVSCSSCAAVVTMKPNVVSDFCPYCGTDIIVSGGTSCSVLKPKYVLPFKIEVKAAKEEFNKWIKSLWWAPNSITKMQNNTEKLQGMYIPYWTYDTATHTKYSGMRGDYYYETESYTDSQGKTQTHRVRKTRWSSTSGYVSNKFDDVLVIASKSLPTKIADDLEPWDLKNLEGFTEHYLSGYRTEAYAVGLEDGFEVVKDKIKGVINKTIESDIGGDTQQIISKDVDYNSITFKHILLPLWISTFNFGGKSYRFLINARTGEVQGERPYSWIKITLAVIAALAVIAGIIVLIKMNQK